MYESFFGMHRRPFLAAPSASRYFAASSIKSARITLTRCIERSAGAGLVIGPSGTGKTLLLHVLAEQFKGRLQPALLTGGHLTTRRALLQVILFELGLPYRNQEEGELRLALIEHLSRSERGPAGMLLLVDEAHALPIRLLEEVRMITNLVRHGQPCVHLVLAGGAALEDRLASPKLDSLNQRLAGRCYLDALDRSETREYVRHQIAAAGGRPDDVLAPDAVDAVYQATGGVPRLIIQLCDQALMQSYADGQPVVGRQVVEQAWSDLQRLPAPWVGGEPATARNAADSGVIEFGQLDEEAPSADLPAVIRETDEHPSDAPTYEATHADVSDLGELADLGHSEVTAAEMDPSPVLAETAVSFWQEPLESAIIDAAAAEAPFEAVGADVETNDVIDEVVVDRYAAIDARREKAVPGMPAADEFIQVSSDASKPPTPDVAPDFARPAPDEMLTLAEALLFRELTGLDAPRQGTQDIAAEAATGVGDAVADWADQPVPIELDDAPVELVLKLAGVGAAVDVVQPDAEHIGFADRSDPDLIVVENDPPRAQLTIALPTNPSVPVASPRQGYSQLFARLRRGENG